MIRIDKARRATAIEDLVEPRKVKHVSQAAAGMQEWIGGLDNVSNLGERKGMS